MSELVTGDAVVLELRPARLPSRALAQAIDTALLLIVFVVLSIALALATSTLDEAAVAAVSVASFLLVLVGGPIAVETLSHGRSLGKLACGLRVVREDGGPIAFRHALVRGAMGVVEILSSFGGVAAIASLVSDRGRRLGDVFAGTLVVRERVPDDRSRPLPPPPPWLATRFAQLDLSAVPDEFWLSARQYVSRLHQLDPAVGYAIGERLAGELTARTAVPPPEGVPHAAYVAAVLHERRTREVRRLSSAERAADRAPGAAARVPVPGAGAAVGAAVGRGASAGGPFAGPEVVPAPLAAPVTPVYPVAPAAAPASTGFAPPA
ncbi:RDD family protein [Streptomyces sp. NPDC060184]|uniref:RDD family protein n=1 Tax=Streptomyces sp. NPDC060184 TaxID=3347064 RepID=UPI003657EB0D